jgi:hypothetical protein
MPDLRMPPTRTDEGLRAPVGIRDAAPATGVLVVSQYDAAIASQLRSTERAILSHESHINETLDLTSENTRSDRHVLAVLGWLTNPSIDD